ncbi:MAG: DMT family transporter [Fimbriimonadaceae bacterium]|nr:DMT family transporter [Fimbriimonadaceae bacterium]
MTWPRRWPHPALVFVVLAWGVNFSVIRESYKSFTPEAVAVLRWTGMVPWMFVLAKLGRQDLSMDRALRWRVWLAGFLSSGVYMAVFVAGMAHTSATQGSIALATAPIWITWFAMALRQEAFRWSAVYGPLVAFGGVVLVISKSGPVQGTVQGTLLCLLSAVIWAVSVVYLRPILREEPALKVMTVSLPAAGLALLPYGGAAVLRVDWAHVGAVGWACMAYLVLVAGSSAYVAYYKAIEDLGPSRAGTTQFLVPPTALVVESLFHWRAPVWTQVVGVAVVLFGVWLSTRQPTAKPVRWTP